MNAAFVVLPSTCSFHASMDPCTDWKSQLNSTHGSLYLVSIVVLLSLCPHRTTKAYVEMYLSSMKS